MKEGGTAWVQRIGGGWRLEIEGAGEMWSAAGVKWSGGGVDSTRSRFHSGLLRFEVFSRYLLGPGLFDLSTKPAPTGLSSIKYGRDKPMGPELYLNIAEP